MQKGIISPIILIAAVVISLVVLGIGYFLFQNSAPKKQTVELPPEYLIPPPNPGIPANLGTPECPDMDYTGCDTSANFMTWDGTVSQDGDTRRDSTGTIYSK